MQKPTPLPKTRLNNPATRRTIPARSVAFGFLLAFCFTILASAQASFAQQSPAPKQDESAKPVAELPIEVVGDHTLIKISVKGHDQPLNFVLDTGAGSTVLNANVAKKIGLKSNHTQSAMGASGSQSYELITGQSLLLTEAVVCENVHFVLVDLGDLSSSLGREIGGITGFDVFSKFLTKLDHDDKTLTLYSQSADVNTEGGLKLDFEWRHGRIPLVETTFQLPSGDEFTGKALLDTGAGLSLVVNTPFNKKHKLKSHANTSYETIARGLNGESRNDVVRGKSLSLAGHEFGEFELELSNSEAGVMSDGSIMGILGNQVLKRFDILLDYKNRTLFLFPNRMAKEAFHFNLTGLRLLESDGKIKVHSVVSQSPAETSGFKAGDQIVSFDGVAATRVTAIREQLRVPGKKVTFEVQRQEDSGPTKHTINMTLKRLL